jgi:hypothetical protein
MAPGGSDNAARPDPEERLGGHQPAFLKGLIAGGDQIGYQVVPPG